jgi:hypothetical protein
MNENSSTSISQTFDCRNMTVNVKIVETVVGPEEDDFWSATRVAFVWLCKFVVSRACSVCKIKITDTNIVLFIFTDKRVKQIPLMDTPIPTAACILLYLSWVVVIGPYYMRDRKPFNLKNTLIYYNAFQVLLSAYMFYEVSLMLLKTS